MTGARHWPRRAWRCFANWETSEASPSLSIDSALPPGDMPITATARVLMEEDLTLYRELGNADRIAWSLFALGLIDIKQGEYTQASASFEEGLALFRELENKRGIAASLTQTAAALFVSQR